MDDLIAIMGIVALLVVAGTTIGVARPSTVSPKWLLVAEKTNAGPGACSKCDVVHDGEPYEDGAGELSNR